MYYKIDPKQMKDEVLNITRDYILRSGEGGILVSNLVIPKADIPEDITNKYKEVKVQWAEQRVANETLKTEKIKKMNEEMKVIPISLKLIV